MSEITYRPNSLKEMGAQSFSFPFSSPVGQELHQCELTTAALESIEQGVWTVISYFAEMDLEDSLKVARKMRCSILSIHELDWERLEEVFGNKSNFLRRYSSTLFSEKAKLTSRALVEAFKEATGTHKSILVNGSHVDRIYRIGMVVGSAAALGEVFKINPDAANQISGIVSAPIALDSSNLLTEIATF